MTEVELIRKLSKDKQEPDWMLERRLEAYALFLKLDLPTWGPSLAELKLDDIKKYIEPQVTPQDKWHEIQDETRAMLDALKIPNSEHDALLGSSVQLESSSIYRNIKEQAREQGIVYLSLEEAERDPQYAEVVREHFASVVRADEQKFAALNFAFWSGGSFIYVPKNTCAKLPIQAYFRFNSESAGQFEHSLIVLDEGAELEYIEGCSAPRLSKASLHAGCVEIIVGKKAHLRYITVENWSKNVYNLSTKRAILAADASIDWVIGAMGSKTSMVYPCSVLAGEGGSSSFLGFSLASEGQNLDSGAKNIHLANNTSSIVRTRQIVRGGGRIKTRSLTKVIESAKNCRSYTDCLTVLVDDGHYASEPVYKIDNNSAAISHEATTNAISPQKIDYLRSRGISEETAKTLIVRGFASDFANSLPFEYAVEINQLISLEMAK